MSSTTHLLLLVLLIVAGAWWYSNHGEEMRPAEALDSSVVENQEDDVENE